MWSFKDSDNITDSLNKQVRKWKMIGIWKPKREKKKDVICEAIFKGTLKLGVQDFKPWCKVKIKTRLEVSLRNQSRCFGDVLNASQKLWVAEWTFPPLLPA